jgi:hypothetical protein
MENLNDIFNLSLDDFKENEKTTSSGGRLIFKPEAKSGKDGVYKAVVRFLPWHQDVKKSIMKKQVPVKTTCGKYTPFRNIQYNFSLISKSFRACD